MCLYPKLIKNRKYTSNKKNGGNIPAVNDERVKYVPIGCQNCIECRKQKAREWQVRLLEDIKTNTNGKFITLTLNNEQYKNLSQEIELEGYARDNAIATLAVRRWLERYRKKHKTSIRHWLITELGHNGTENIHLHGIIWTNKPLEEIEQIWQYGFMWKGKKTQIKNQWGALTIQTQNYVTPKTVTYITKYVTKTDERNTQYKPIILTSPGIGSNYTKTFSSKQNAYNETQTNETYRTTTGHKIAIPVYWRNKIYNEEQREKLWLQKLDKQERWICGERISIKQGEHRYFKLLKYHQQRNIKLGYGDDTKDWNKKQYEEQRRNLKHKERLEKTTNKENNQRKKLSLKNNNYETVTIGNSRWIITADGIKRA